MCTAKLKTCQPWLLPQHRKIMQLMLQDRSARFEANICIPIESCGRKRLGGMPNKTESLASG